MNQSKELHPLKELAIRAQIPDAEADEAIHIITVQDDPAQPNFGLSNEEFHQVVMFLFRLINLPTGGKVNDDGSISFELEAAFDLLDYTNRWHSDYLRVLLATIDSIRLCKPSLGKKPGAALMYLFGCLATHHKVTIRDLLRSEELLHHLKELAIRAQIPDAEADEAIHIITAQDDPAQPNLGRSAKDMETVRRFRDAIVEKNVINTPI